MLLADGDDVAVVMMMAMMLLLVVVTMVVDAMPVEVVVKVIDRYDR